jgi:hypothetical protein
LPEAKTPEEKTEEQDSLKVEGIRRIGQQQTAGTV